MNMTKKIQIFAAFALVVLACVAASALAGKQAGEQAARSGAESGAKAGREEVQRVAKQYAYDITKGFVTSQRAGCERNNNRTRESNRRIILHDRQNRAITLVASGARQARLRSYAKTHEQLDIDAVRNFYEPAIKLVESIHFAKFELVPCAIAYPMPPKP